MPGFALCVHFTTFFSCVAEKRPSLHVSQPASYKWSEKQVKNEEKCRAMSHFLHTWMFALKKTPKEKKPFFFFFLKILVFLLLSHFGVLLRCCPKACIFISFISTYTGLINLPACLPFCPAVSPGVIQASRRRQ